MSFYIRITAKCQSPWHGEAVMRQRCPKCKIFGHARRPAPTKACRGDPPWSPVSTLCGSFQPYVLP